MAEDKEIMEIRGTLKQKKDATTKKNKAYFQMLIGDMWFSLWNTELAEGISTGMRVVAYYTQTVSGDKTFNNMTAIELDETITPTGVPVEKVEVESPPTETRTVPPREETKPMTLAEGKGREADKFELGMAKHIAAELLKRETFSDDKAMFQRYSHLVNTLFFINQETRKTLLGY